MNLKNEAAALVTLVGLTTLVVMLAGVALLVGVAFGGGGVGQAAVGALATVIGGAGLAGVLGAISSGYFITDDAADLDPSDTDDQPTDAV